VSGSRKSEPPEGEAGEDGYPSHAEVFAMTLRHGADCTKRYLDSLARREASVEDDAHA
jgi:hypothetical protein